MLETYAWPPKRGSSVPFNRSMQVLDAKISVMQKLDILVCCFGLRKVQGLLEHTTQLHGCAPCHAVALLVQWHVRVLMCRGSQVCNHR